MKLKMASDLAQQKDVRTLCLRKRRTSKKRMSSCSLSTFSAATDDQKDLQLAIFRIT